MQRFQPERYYLTTDPELLLLGTPAALAKQRTRGEGPRYHKVGKRVLYRGSDLNAFLDSCVIEPASSRGGVARHEPATDAGKPSPELAGVVPGGLSSVRPGLAPRTPAA